MKKQPRKTIGRTLNQSTPLANDNKQEFILASGQKAFFQLINIPTLELKTKTSVDFSTNGRLQEALTPESLSDITRTIHLHQFFPAIGYYLTDGTIEILDGSRRRAAAIISGVGLNILVTNEKLSLDDARLLATDIQTAKEHNLREIGLRLLMLRDSGMNNKEIAIENNLSPSRVTRAIQAASVPSTMLLLFPDQAELTHPDYRLLLDIASKFKAKELDLNVLISKVDALTEDAVEKSSEDVKNHIVKKYAFYANDILENPSKDKAKLEKIWDFSDKDTFARKRIKGRNIKYEFGRLPKALQSELDSAISKAFNSYFEENSPK